MGLNKQKQRYIAKNIKSSILLWELIVRDEVSGFILKDDIGDKLLYQDKNNLWVVRRIRNAKEL